jgi:1-acyl-sn-glycerol-3-phosphate acyltransferase
MIIAPNHPSVLDAMILISRLDRLTCIMKASVLDNPLLGASARLAGYIRDDRALRMLRLASSDLKAGDQLVIFPEGTRTVSEPVNDFTRGFAAIARAARVPVQAVIIETDTPYLSKGWPVLLKPARLPMTFRIRLGERFEVGHDINGFVHALRAYFIRELGDVERGGPRPVREQHRPRLAPRRAPPFKSQSGPMAIPEALQAARPDAVATGDRRPRP